MGVLMAVKLINNTLTLFFRENGCKKDRKSQYFIMREIVSKILYLPKILENKLNQREKEKSQKIMMKWFYHVLNYIFAEKQILLQVLD